MVGHENNSCHISSSLINLSPQLFLSGWYVYLAKKSCAYIFSLFPQRSFLYPQGVVAKCGLGTTKHAKSHSIMCFGIVYDILFSSMVMQSLLLSQDNVWWLVGSVRTLLLFVSQLHLSKFLKIYLQLRSFKIFPTLPNAIIHLSLSIYIWFWIIIMCNGRIWLAENSATEREYCGRQSLVYWVKIILKTFFLM